MGDGATWGVGDRTLPQIIWWVELLLHLPNKFRVRVSKRSEAGDALYCALEKSYGIEMQ